MSSANSSVAQVTHRKPPALTWVVLGGILTALAFPLQPIPFAPPMSVWPVIFVSLAPFLARLMCATTLKETACTALVFAGPWFVIAGVWVFRVFDTLGWILIWIPVVWIIIFACAANLVRWCGFAVSWSWPLLWISVEFIRSEWSPGRLDWLSAELDPLNFTWFGLGHPRLVWPPAAQSADLIGGYGLALAPFLTNLLIAKMWTQNGSRVLLAVVVSMCLADAAYCGWRWHHHQIEPTVSVGVVQSERYELPILLQLTDNLLKAAPETKLVVWPELAFSAKPGDKERLHDIARQRGITLVTGVEIPMEHAYRNRAWWLPAEGLADEYAKQTRVPFVERHPASDICSTFSFPTERGPIRVGILICYDIDFARPARRLVNECGAELIVLPTLDDGSWGGTQHVQHSLLPRLRAIENRRPIVQAATSGVSQILDARGSPQVEIPFRLFARPDRPTSFHEGFATGAVQPSSDPSIYGRFGHFLPSILAALSLAILSWAAGWQGLANFRRD